MTSSFACCAAASHGWNRRCSTAIEDKPFIEQRMAFQEVMRGRFEAVIQHATGRAVIGFMSGNQQDPDMICEVFILSPTSLVEEDDARALGETPTPSA